MVEGHSDVASFLNYCSSVNFFAALRTNEVRYFLKSQLNWALVD